MIVWISRALALAIHDRQLAEHGGATGIRDEGLLESALARARQLVAEADESDGSLVKFAAHLGVITNIELDHTDHYPDLAALVLAGHTHGGGDFVEQLLQSCPTYLQIPQLRRIRLLQQLRNQHFELGYRYRRLPSQGCEESSQVSPHTRR